LSAFEDDPEIKQLRGLQGGAERPPEEEERAVRRSDG
jgi:hypothetical protein